MRRWWPYRCTPRKVARALCLVCAVVVTAHAMAQLPASSTEQAPQGDLRRGRELLMNQHFGEARQVFAGYLAAHPTAVQARLGLGDAQLGLRQYEAAELTYRAAVAAEPELWQAHKNLVVVEAALHRWDEFDRERTLLRMARQRGAPGISSRESDVIDRFDLDGSHWVVRSYFEPVGRSQARYNFEQFRPDGRVLAYISLEDSAAAAAALHPGDIRIGAKDTENAGVLADAGTLSLNWYTGAAHGTVREFRSGEPSYRQLRADTMAWLRQHPQLTHPEPHSGAGADTGRPGTQTPQHP